MNEKNQLLDILGKLTLEGNLSKDAFFWHLAKELPATFDYKQMISDTDTWKNECEDMDTIYVEDLESIIEEISAK